MLFSNDSLDYNKPKKPGLLKNRKFISLIILVIIVVTSVLVWAIVKQQNSATTTDLIEPTVTEQALEGVETADIDSLIETIAFAETEEDAKKIIELFKSFDVDNCKELQELKTSSELEGKTYQQTTFECPYIKDPLFEDRENALITFTSYKEQVIFYEISASSQSSRDIEEVVYLLENSS